jgi:crotonobetainyl-CoA:carnitine CoA-transferase CaiB-like acyl-CoA transferase
VLALEQMQAVPVLTFLMARLGADVVKVESPPRGDSGRQAQPAMVDERGERVGATFVRYNLGKRSVAVDFRTPEGRDLLLRLAPAFDVVCENLGPGRATTFGLDYEAVRAVHAAVVYLSVSGFGSPGPGGAGDSPYATWPAYAGVAEAMSGIYEYARRPGQPPVINPVGGLGDTGTGLYGLIGILAALRHRDRTGEGQFVDVAMFDAMVAMCDIVANFWSMGMRREPDEPARVPYILDGFRAADGWFMVQVGREHQFERLARAIGHEEWLGDERLASRFGWSEHLEDVVRPGIEHWAATRTKGEAAADLAAAGVTAAPCNGAEDLVSDPHVALRHMLLEIPRTDGVDQPVLVSGNPVKMSRLAEPEGRRLPAMGEHTDEVLAEDLGLDAAELDALAARGVIHRA